MGDTKDAAPTAEKQSATRQQLADLETLERKYEAERAAFESARIEAVKNARVAVQKLDVVRQKLALLKKKGVA